MGSRRWSQPSDRSSEHCSGLRLVGRAHPASSPRCVDRGSWLPAAASLPPTLDGGCGRRTPLVVRGKWGRSASPSHRCAAGALLPPSPPGCGEGRAGPDSSSAAACARRSFPAVASRPPGPRAPRRRPEPGRPRPGETGPEQSAPGCEAWRNHRPWSGYPSPLWPMSPGTSRAWRRSRGCTQPRPAGAGHEPANRCCSACAPRFLVRSLTWNGRGRWRGLEEHGESEPSGGLKGYGSPPGKRAGRLVRRAQPQAWSWLMLRAGCRVGASSAGSCSICSSGMSLRLMTALPLRLLTSTRTPVFSGK